MMFDLNRYTSVHIANKSHMNVFEDIYVLHIHKHIKTHHVHLHPSHDNHGHPKVLVQ